MLRRLLLLVVGVVLSLGMTQTVCVAETQLVAGAGPSTVIAQLFFEAFSANPAARGYEFVVPALSAKHAGGVRSTDQFIFGRTGRLLNAKEKGLGKDEIILARVPIVFVAGGGAGVGKISLENLQAIYEGKLTNWKELGGADAKILTVGREDTEAALGALKKSNPFFTVAQFAQVFRKDHQVVDFLTSPEGRYALVFGAKPNFSAATLLEVPGLTAGVSVGLVYDLRNRDLPVVQAAGEYAGSPEWRAIVARNDLLPAE